MTTQEMLDLMPEDFCTKPLAREDILTAVNDQEWQRFRAELKGVSTVIKIKSLAIYLSERRHTERSEAAEVQVINYINALKRGGQIVD